ncbi:MAG TPA: universal stress protein [Thermoguttaceae bacterium]|nr:universal stress protein [Thermoguttaceae bacterium]
MKLMERILVATDFGSGADEALRMAVFVAKHFQSEIVLLHVVPGSSHWYSRAVDMIRTDVEAELHDARDRVQAEGVAVVETLVDFGVPFDKINRRADERDANLIILGARETAASGPCGLGSTATEVRRRASKPVWIVKPGTAPPIHKVLCPVDFSDPSGRALQNAIHLSRGFEAELTVLTAIPASGYHERTGETVAEAEETRVFERFLQDFDFHNVKSTNLIRRGKPQEEIMKVVGERESDLLVTGSVGRRGLGRMLMGGVARKVAREMPCSMVTVRSEHAIRLRLDAESTDIEAHFKQGHELLALGFPEEAGRQFRRCIAKDSMHAPAWEGLAAVHKRLGQHEEAKRLEEQAERINQKLYHKQIEAEIRGQHPLFRPIFGIK